MAKKGESYELNDAETILNGFTAIIAAMLYVHTNRTATIEHAVGVARHFIYESIRQNDSDRS